MGHKDWFSSLHNSRVNHMTRFLLAKTSEVHDKNSHNTTIFTDARERRMANTPKARPDSTRNRMSSVSGGIDPRRFDSYKAHDVAGQEEHVRRDSVRASERSGARDAKRVQSKSLGTGVSGTARERRE